MNPFSNVAGSKVSVVEPWREPTRKWPPIFGVIAIALLAIDNAVGRATPIAMADEMNCRRSIVPAVSRADCSFKSFDFATMMLSLLRLLHR